MPKNVDIDFKLAYSTTTFKLQVDIEETVTDFILYAKKEAKDILNITDDYDIEIVKAGQFYNQNGRDPEIAPALTNSDYTLYDYYKDDIYYKDGIYYGRFAFYVRVKKDNVIVHNLKINVPDEDSEKVDRGTPPPPFSHYDSEDDWDIQEHAL